MSEMISRRSFLKVAGVSVVGAAAFGLTGCGGSGGGGASAVSTVYHKVDLSKLAGMNEDEAKAEMETWPQTNKVLFPYTYATGNVNGEYDVLEIQFSVSNQSADKTVVFEHTEDEYDDFMEAMDNQNKTLAEGIEAAKKYASKEFQVSGAEVVISYGCKIKSDATPVTDAKGLESNESGTITLEVITKKGWNNLKIKYKPNFGDGEVYTFEVEPEDVSRRR